MFVRYAIVTNRNCASSELFTLAALHSRSATADARGHRVVKTLVESMNSPHIHASPPRIRFFSSSVPVNQGVQLKKEVLCSSQSNL